jgi:hypothetical protein
MGTSQRACPPVTVENLTACLSPCYPLLPATKYRRESLRNLGGYCYESILELSAHSPSPLGEGLGVRLHLITT